LKANKLLFYLYIGGLIAVPIGLLLLPADFFDSGESVCLSVVLLDQECYACGMTRGVQHLLHLDFMTAASFNRLSFIVLPLLILLWFQEMRRSILRIKELSERQETKEAS
tara:strand:+ start:79885 stop:80214 length:330 start_codon:yes stop_codon:yes gene_type:complete